MKCPQCQRENPGERTTCIECGAALVASDERAEPDAELVEIFETGEATLAPIVRSLLDEEGIEHLVQGEGVQELVGLGRVGGSNIAAGPVRFFVREEDAARARELLAHLAAGEVELPADQDVENP
jgi:hypothetical protein